MNFELLTDIDEIQTAFGEFTKRLESGQLITKSLNFIGGDSGSKIYWHENFGFWVSIGTYENRYLCACGLQHPIKDPEPLEIVCALNPPFGGKINLRFPTLFVRDLSTNTIYLSHDGSFPRTKKAQSEISLKGNWQDIQWSDGKKSKRLLICKINDENLCAELAEFIKRVKEYKDIYRNVNSME
jgi:hypothetical protein